MKLSHDTFRFLSDLNRNNQREWFAENKERYVKAKEQFEGFIEGVIDVFSKKEPSLIGLTGKKSVMRIYRDVRFSTDKSPYKTNFGASLHNPSHKGNFPGYFISISPDESFVAGGYWMPEASLLKAIRQEIDYAPKKFQSILEEKNFVKLFGTLSHENKLKTAPKDYPKDHPLIEILKLKSFTASVPLMEDELCSGKGFDKILASLDALIPLIHFLEEVKV